MHKPKYFIFRYCQNGREKKLVLFDDLKIMINEIGWIRKKNYKVKIIDVVKPSKFKVLELNDDGTINPNGQESIIDFQQFYQGHRLEE